MFCDSCGQENRNAARFCRGCGAELPLPCSTPNEQTVSATIPAETPPPSAPVVDTRRQRKGTITIVVAAGLCISIGTWFAYHQSRPAAATPNASQETMANQGEVIIHFPPPDTSTPTSNSAVRQRGALSTIPAEAPPSHHEFKIDTKYMPDADRTGMGLIGCLAKADLSHGVTRVGIRPMFTCPRHNTSCRNADALLALDVMSFGEDWVFKDKQPQVTFLVDGRRVQLPYIFEWRSSFPTPNKWLRHESLTAFDVSSSLLEALCDGQHLAGEISDVSFELSTQQYREFCEFIKRFE